MKPRVMGNTWKFAWGAGGLAAVAWLAYGAATVHQHGLTVDTPSVFFGGDRTYFWLTHRGVESARDMWGADPVGFHSDFDREYSARGDKVHFPVLPDLVAAASADLLHVRLKLVDNVDGHLLGLVGLHGFGLLAFGVLAVALLGPLAGGWATLFYTLWPAIVGHGFNNPKDSVCVDFYAAGLLAAAWAVVWARPWALAGAGVLFGLSLSSKLNTVFALATLAAWLPLAYLLLYHRRRRLGPGLVAAGLLMPAIAGGVFFIAWPWLSFGNLPDWINHVADYLSFMAGRGASDREGWTDYGLRCLCYMSPPIALFAGAVGLFFGARPTRAEGAIWALLVMWFALPLWRIARPHSDFYDGNRHFLEYIPALCCLAGLGIARLARWLALLAERLPGPRGPALRRGLPIAAAVGVAAAMVLPLVRYAPYETTYFNAFIGGLGGAQRAALFRMPLPHPAWVNGTEGDYWCSSMRSALRLVGQLGPPPWRLAVCGGAGPPVAKSELPPQNPPEVEDYHAGSDVPYIYASPRETHCSWDTIHELERTRPVLHREERGGGVIYELFGPKAAYPLPTLSAPTAYDSRS